MQILNKANLNNLLRSNLPKFIDCGKLSALIGNLVVVKDDMQVLESCQELPRVRTISVSAVEWRGDRISLVADFSMPKNGGVAVGSCELEIQPDGEIASSEISGVVVRPLPRT